MQKHTQPQPTAEDILAADRARRNPHPAGSHEWHLWDAWNDSFFNQAVSGQLYEAVDQLRQHIATVPPERCSDLQAFALEVECTANLFEEIADHAAVAIKTAPPR